MLKKVFMKRIELLILLLVSLSASVSAQRSSSWQIAHGRCIDILKQYKDSTQCDSIAIQLFLQRYYIDSGIYFPSSKWKQAEEFINKEGNTELKCTFKALRREQDLIDNIHKKWSKRLPKKTASFFKT